MKFPHSLLINTLSVLLIGVLSPLPLSGLTTVNTFNSSSRLNSGHWVKVRVKESSIQAIPYSTLQEWGFSNPSQVRVYGFSGMEHDSRLLTPAPDDLPQVPSVHLNNKLIFYGEGNLRASLYTKEEIILPDTEPEFDEDGNPIPPQEPGDTIINRTLQNRFLKNHYSDWTYYFLSDIPTSQLSPEKNTPPAGATGMGQPLTSHYSLQRKYCEEYSNIVGGTYFYSRPLLKGQGRDFTFDMPGYVADAFVSYQAVGLSPNIVIPVNLKLPSSVVARDTAANCLPFLDPAAEYIQFVISDPGCQYFTPLGDKKQHTFSMVHSGNQTDMTCAYQMTLQYKRSNDMSLSPCMLMYYPGLQDNSMLSFPDFPQDLQVWDVTLPLAPKNLPVSSDGQVFLNKGNGAVITAFSPSGTLPQPEYAGEVANQNLHALTTPDLVIVTTPTCREQAERLASLHRNCHQKMDVAVVEQQQVFNEFSSGACSAEAMRKFFQMLYLRNSDKLKYAILFGAGSYDHRRVIDPTSRDYMVAFEVDTISLSSNKTISLCSDQYFGFLDPKRESRLEPSGKLTLDVVPSTGGGSIAVGRIPALTQKEAQAYVDKVEEYLSNPNVAGEYTQMLCIGDLGDKNKHVTEGVEKDATLLKELFPGATVIKAYQELQPKLSYGAIMDMTRTLNNCLSRPVGYVSTSGHATFSSLGKITYLSAPQEANLTYGSMPIFFVGACNPFGIDNPDGSIMSQMLFHENQGPVAVVGAGRTAFMTPNQSLEHSLAKCLYSATADKDCIGDAYLAAFNEMMKKSISTRINTMLYGLGGDPALPLYIPGREIKITEVEDGFTDGLMKLQPGGTNKITGEITSTNGALDSFDGTVTLTVYAPAYDAKLKTMYNADSGYGTTVTLDQDPIATGTATVKDGKWEMNLVLPDLSTPAEISENPYRVSLWAQSSSPKGYFKQRVKTASGGHFAMMDFEKAGQRSSNDTNAPVIENLSALINMDKPILMATISDNQSGIAMSDFNRPTVTLDGQRLHDAILRFTPGDNGKWELRYPLPEIKPGMHTIGLKIKDNAGNSATAATSFSTQSSSGTITVALNDDIVTESVDIDVAMEVADASSAVTTLIITDLNGKTMLKKENPAFPFTVKTGKWDEGYYTVQVMSRNKYGQAHSQPVKFAVIRDTAQR